jgi:ATPase subunit of ABC transporter with duplicated ATPase domains
MPSRSLAERFASLPDPRVERILAGLRFAPAQQDQEISTLSGGEKTRLSLARLLLASPDVLRQAKDCDGSK